MQKNLVHLKKPNSLKKQIYLSNFLIKMITLKSNLNLYSCSLWSMKLATFVDLEYEHKEVELCPLVQVHSPWPYKIRTTSKDKFYIILFKAKYTISSSIEFVLQISCQRWPSIFVQPNFH